MRAALDPTGAGLVEATAVHHHPTTSGGGGGGV